MMYIIFSSEFYQERIIFQLFYFKSNLKFQLVLNFLLKIEDYFFNESKNNKKQLQSIN